VTSLKASAFPPIATDLSTHDLSSVCLYVSVSSVTLVHPAEAVRQNGMLFGRDTRVVQSNIVLDRGQKNPIFGLKFFTENFSKIFTCKWKLILRLMWSFSNYGEIRCLYLHSSWKPLLQ